MNPLPPTVARHPDPCVLVHEYRDALRSALLQALDDHGLHDVIGLPSAVGLLQDLQGSAARVLLLDLDAPDTDGLALCRAIRERHPNLGVIAMSARLSSEDVVRGLRAGADQLLRKPVEPQELLAYVQRLLQRQTGSSAMRF